MAKKSHVRPLEPIPGSYYYRDYCSDCGCAIRVIRSHIEDDKTNYCEKCGIVLKASLFGNLTLRQKAKLHNIGVDGDLGDAEVDE